MEITEAEWLASTDPVDMLEYLRGRGADVNAPGGFRVKNAPSERKLRLFACACCREALRLTSGGNTDSLSLCDLSDRYADGLIYYQELAAFAPTHPDCSWPLRYDLNVHTTVMNIINAKLFLPGQAALLRDIFGNPWRAIHPFAIIHPHWLTWNDCPILAMAQTIYDERRFEDIPILADALEEAGCTNEDILNHCRQITQCSVGPECKHHYAPHVRGCWVVDLLLGKE